jgi:hypothetical protein
MRREDVGLFPFVDKGIDFGRDKLSQDAAWFLVISGKKHFFVFLVIPGRLRSGRTRNLDPLSRDSGSALTHGPE